MTTIREIIKDSYMDYILIQPKMMSFSKGIYENNVRKIMGSNTTFEELFLKTNIPLDKKELYFIERYRNEPFGE